MSTGTQDTPLFTLTRGSGTLSGGTVTVTNSAALTTSMIVLSGTNSSSVSSGSLRISSKSNGSFVVSSNNILDVATFDFVIMN